MIARLHAEQDFVVHVFALLDGPGAEAAYAEIRRLWSCCRDELGMTQPILAVGLPTSLPDRREELPNLAEIAALESPDRDFQAIVRRDRNLLCLAVALAPQNRPVGRHALAPRGETRAAPTWRELDQRWSLLANPDSGALLGEVRLYLGRMSEADSDPVDASSQSIDIAVPLVDWMPRDDGWTERGVLLEEGVAAWEATSREDGRFLRRIVALADHDKNAQQSAWFWSRGDAVMPPFGGYLRYAAEIRYELRVWQGGERSRVLRERADANVGELRRLLDDAPGPEADTATSTVLRGLRIDETDLVLTSSTVREMRSAVEISASNMQAALGRGLPDRGTRHFVFADRALADWFARELSDAADRLDSTRDRVHRIRALGAERERSADRADTSTSKGFRVSGGQDLKRKVFVVHGRDRVVQEKMFDFLRALDLVPMEWEPQVAATGSTLPSLTDVITHNLSAGQAQAVVVLMTPDDVVNLHPTLRSANEQSYETEPIMQARPNVLIELGLALAAYRHRTIILEIGRLRPISDIGGLNVIRFDGSDAAIRSLVARLKVAECAVDDRGTEWSKTSRFENLDAYTRRPPK